MKIKKRIPFIAAVGLLAALGGGSVLAYHSWGNYHWARTANPFTLNLGNNVSGGWQEHLAKASADWSVSDVLDTKIVSARSGNPRSCRAVNGRGEVCSAWYGNNGWLGVAQIWASGDHITKGTVKLNDFYFDLEVYNTPAWKNLVMCQEIGHLFGLGHQDEDFYNAPLGTCMDYSADPEPNQQPNAHDYEQLALIYSHLDSFTTLKEDEGSGGKGRKNGSEIAEWGRAIRYDASGKPSVYAKDLGKGEKVYTFVFWAR